jgi:hypothetical protein
MDETITYTASLFGLWCRCWSHGVEYRNKKNTI